MIVNHTKQAIQVCQKGTAECIMIPVKERIPFHWADKNRDKLVCVKAFSAGVIDLSENESSDDYEEFEWSSGFNIAELGALSI